MECAAFKVTGLSTPPVTPFKSNGDVDFDAIGPLAQHIADFSISSLFVNGSTGEGPNLTLEERKQTAETWVKAAKGKIDSVMIHVGTDNLRNSIELAKHAQEIGADAIVCVAPSYFKPITVDNYVEYMKNVAAAAPKLPFYLYDIQMFTGYTVRADEFFKVAASQIPTLRGLKHTTPDFVSMNNIIIGHQQKYNLMLGTDETFLEGLVNGADTTVCNSYLGHVFNRLKEAFNKGDIQAARIEQARAFQLSNMRKKYGLGPADGSKAILTALGLNVGQARLPLPKYTSVIVQNIKNDLKEMGFFEWGANK